MHEIWTIARNDIRKMLRSGSTYFSPIIMLAASISYILGYNKIITTLISQDATSQAIYEASRSYLNTVLYLWPLAYSLLASSIGSNMLV